jgi:hypothetical protein
VDGSTTVYGRLPKSEEKAVLKNILNKWGKLETLGAYINRRTSQG